jgi:hypothetical protein
MSNISNLKKIFLDDNNIGKGTQAWRAYLDGEGYTGRSLVDNTKELLVATGNWTGNINESLLSLFAGGGVVFDPSDLFGGGEEGVWYDPSDLTTLFQDSAGNNPVASDGDPVAVVFDKSNGVLIDAELVSNSEFVDDVSDWIERPSTSRSQSGGQLTVTTTAAGQGVYQTLGALTSGQMYLAEVNVISNTTDFNVLVGPSWSLGGTGSTGRQSSSGVHYAILTGGGGNLLQLYSYDAGDVVYEVVSIKELAGVAATQTTSAKRPTYRTDGTLHWLEFDGVDDELIVDSTFASVNHLALGYKRADSSNSIFLQGATDAGEFIGAMQAGSGSSPTAGAGTPVYRVNGVDVSPSTRDQLSDDVPSGVAKSIEADGMDLTTWARIDIGGYSSFQMSGDLFGFFVGEGLDETDRSNLRDYMAEKSGITI